MPKYICRTKCYYRKREWKVGETFDSAEGEVVPGHFEPKGTKKIEIEVPEDTDPKTFAEAAKIQAEEEKKALGQFSEENINSDTPPAAEKQFNFLE